MFPEISLHRFSDSNLVRERAKKHLLPALLSPDASKAAINKGDLPPMEDFLQEQELQTIFRSSSDSL